MHVIEGLYTNAYISCTKHPVTSRQSLYFIFRFERQHSIKNMDLNPECLGSNLSCGTQPSYLNSLCPSKVEKIIVSLPLIKHLWKFNEIIYLKNLQQRQAFSKCCMNVCCYYYSFTMILLLPFQHSSTELTRLGLVSHTAATPLCLYFTRVILVSVPRFPSVSLTGTSSLSSSSCTRQILVLQNSSHLSITAVKKDKPSAVNWYFRKQ